MESTETTLWQDWKEWVEVRHGLLYGTPEECEWALQRVNVWRQRGTLPVAVESTQEIVLLMARERLQPVLDDALLSLCEEMSTRLSWAMALIRFVNGFADQLQTGESARPVLVMIRQLGVSESLVSLRHEATHSQLPPTPQLRSACSHALDWLIGSYWNPLHDHLLRQTDTFRQLLVRYVRLYAVPAKRQKKLTHLVERLSLPSLQQLFADCFVQLFVPAAAQHPSRLFAASAASLPRIEPAKLQQCGQTCLDALCSAFGPSLGYALLVALAPFAATPPGAAWIEFLFSTAVFDNVPLNLLPRSAVAAAASCNPDSPLLRRLLPPVHSADRRSLPDLDDVEQLLDQLRRAKKKPRQYYDLCTPIGQSFGPLEPTEPVAAPLLPAPDDEPHTSNDTTILSPPSPSSSSVIDVSLDEEEEQTPAPARPVRQKRLRWL